MKKSQKKSIRGRSIRGRSIRGRRRQKGGEDNFVATRYIYGENDPTQYMSEVIRSDKLCFPSNRYLYDDVIFNMVFNPYTDLWIVTNNDEYVAHTSVNYAREIGNLMAFPLDNGILRPEDKFNLIWNVCVDSSYRGRNICNMLIHDIIAEENNPNVYSFALNVLPENEPAIKCYKKNGFQLFSQTPEMNIMTNLPDLPEYNSQEHTPMEGVEQFDICESMASLKVKGKLVFVHILGHGAVLPLPITPMNATIKDVADRATPIPVNNPIFPQIFGNSNLRNAVLGHSTEIHQFPFFLPRARVLRNHNMHIVEAESGCISVGPIILDEIITKTMGMLTTSEDINIKKTLKDLTKRLNKSVNEFVGDASEYCRQGKPYGRFSNIKRLEGTATRLKFDYEIENQSINCAITKNVFKSVENWPDGSICPSSASASAKQTQQNNKIYSKFDDLDAMDRVRYNRIVHQSTNVLTPEVKRLMAHDTNGPLVKLFFSDDNNNVISIIVPTHYNITLTDILNRISFILALYGIQKSEMIIVDNSCSAKDPDTWAFRGGKERTKKNKGKKARRTVRRRGNLARR